MFLYLSTFTTVSIGARSLTTSTAQAAGADGPRISLGQRCIVGSTFALATPLPTGVRFLLQIPDDLDVLVPDAAVTAINNQLGTSIELQKYAWRALFRRLFKDDAPGRWNPLQGDRLVFGPRAADRFDI